MTNCTAWGGFTWNEKLLPDPAGFQAYLHSSRNPLGHPLATSLNGHPDSGVGPCQQNYSAFAAAIGADPRDQANFKCEMDNATWTRALFDTMLDPKGIDWWWTDCKDLDTRTRSLVVPNPPSLKPLSTPVLQACSP